MTDRKPIQAAGVPSNPNAGPRPHPAADLPADHADADEAAHRQWLVDEESEESFPASDPPSWTLGSR